MNSETITNEGSLNSSSEIETIFSEQPWIWAILIGIVVFIIIGYQFFKWKISQPVE